MQLSARNQLPGTVSSIKEGTVMAEIIVTLDNGPELVSVITAESARRLQLALGSKVTVVIKATEVLVAAGD
jgi:molybdopterin-binding protein